MAAGLSLPEENILKLRRELNENTTMTKTDMTEKVLIDMQLPLEEIQEDFIEELSLLEPFGKANGKPVFAERGLEFKKARILGKNRNVLKFEVCDTKGTYIDAMFFGDPEEFFGYLSEKYGMNSKERLLNGCTPGMLMDITYYPGINEYMGRKSLQIVIKDYR